MFLKEKWIQVVHADHMKVTVMQLFSKNEFKSNRVPTEHATTVKIITDKLTGSRADSSSIPSSLPLSQRSGGSSCRTSWRSEASFPHRVCLWALGISCTTSSTSKGSVLSFCSVRQTRGREAQLETYWQLKKTLENLNTFILNVIN